MQMPMPFPEWDTRSKILAGLVALLLLVVGFQAWRLSRHGAASPGLPVSANRAPEMPSAALPVVPMFPDLWSGTPTSPSDLQSQMDQFHRQMNRLFSDMMSRMERDEAAFASPRLDLREERDRYVVRLDMPGADKASIKVNVEGQTLTVAGTREVEGQRAPANGKALHQERNLAQFERVIQLPTAVKPDAVEARYENGVLTVTLPKAGGTAPSATIPVR